MSSQPLATTQRVSPLVLMAQRFNMDPTKMYTTLCATVIKGTREAPATQEQVAAFVIVANEYGLNPFLKEIHAFTSREAGIVPIVGIDGWTRIVNRDDRFDGVEFDSIFNDQGQLTGITCTMYVKNRSRPVKVTEWMSECKRNTIPWQTMPSRMLRHKAFMQAARYAFSLSGIYDDDEGRDIIQNAKIVASDGEQTAPRGVAGLAQTLAAQPPAGPTEPEPTRRRGRPPGSKKRAEEIPLPPDPVKLATIDPRISNDEPERVEMSPEEAEEIRQREANEQMIPGGQ